MKYLIVYENGETLWRDDTDLSAFSRGDNVGLHFRLRADSKKDYSDVEIYSDDGEFIDSCFVSCKWENVNAEINSYIDGEKRCVVLSVLNPYGENLRIKDVKFNAPLGNLFDGGVLFQLAAAKAQAMGYVFVAKDGKVIAVDGGGKEDKFALKEIIDKSGGTVHHWFITHYHNDHIGAIIELFKENAVKVENLYYDFPTAEVLSDRGDGDNALVGVWNDYLPKNANIIKPKRGDKFDLGSTCVTVLNSSAFDVLCDFANNSSVVYKMNTGKTNVLFTGDLERKGEEYLEDVWFRKQLSDCTVVQMAHHGQKGVSERFYDATSVKVCLYPTPLWLWNNDNGGGKNSAHWTTLQTRELMREKNVRRSFTSIQNKITEIY